MIENIIDYRSRYSQTNSDRVHRAHGRSPEVIQTYDLPFGKRRAYMLNAPGAVNAALGDWQVSWITYPPIERGASGYRAGWSKLTFVRWASGISSMPR